MSSDHPTLQDIADSILWAPDRPAVDRLWEYADPEADDPDMEAYDWVQALKHTSEFGVALHLGREKYMRCSRRSVYRLEGQPYPNPLEVRRQAAIDIVNDHIRTVEPVPIEVTPFAHG
ncbi:hypothetical protein [Natrinema pallidum]|uniref:Uncharacterized protein n=1 Tax=Natrinema pallidum TaxID=69527 RepID=A0A4V1IFK2_9EURY|nr:hypothetical protein [Natrinema pallidum]QCW05284.1 hypothetical protein FGF80_18755 [Natrinema pallidum]